MLSFISYRLRRLKRSTSAKLALLSPKFNRLLATSTPILKIEYPTNRQNRTLIVFLPGIDDLAEDFERRGVIDDLRQQGIAADVVAVDAHYGYYATEAIFERMTDDVIFSARVAGYEEIWLAGVSLGGFGAALYAAHHEGQIDGLMLLAPYLGRNSLVHEIGDAGGILHWNSGNFVQDDVEYALWEWFRDLAVNPASAMRVYLGYGVRDKFAKANALLAEALPKDRVFAIEGGHDWRTWKSLWRIFLEGWKMHSPGISQQAP